MPLHRALIQGERATAQTVLSAAWMADHQNEVGALRPLAPSEYRGGGRATNRGHHCRPRCSEQANRRSAQPGQAGFAFSRGSFRLCDEQGRLRTTQATQVLTARAADQIRTGDPKLGKLWVGCFETLGIITPWVLSRYHTWVHFTKR